MASTLMDLKRHHISDRGGMAGQARKPKYPPIRHGKRVLARFEVARSDRGFYNWRDTGRSTLIGCKVIIASGNQAGRFFWISFMAAGNVGRVNWSKDQLRAMMDCDRIPASRESYPDIEKMVEHVDHDFDDRLYPIEIVQEPHWETGRPTNNILALSPNPDHWAWESYHELVKALGDKVPGSTLYPDSPSTLLVQKRAQAATVVREDGQTLAERRKGQGRARSVAIRQTKPQLSLKSLLWAG